MPESSAPSSSYCLNPACPQPQNPQDAQTCSACGSLLCLRDRYRAKALLGQGGFGATFLAIDLALPGQPHCALKQLRPGKTGNTSDLNVARKLFAREAETLGTIGSHPQIPRLLDYFEIDGHFYLVQEYIEGQTLAREIKQNGPLDEAGLRQFLLAILPCIDYIHTHRVIHRDIKPQNIIRRRTDRQLVLIDFGAVRYAISQFDTATHNGPLTESAVWTPGYSAPEQMALRPVFASDIYSLGVTCLHLLTGKPPQSLGYDEETGLIDWQREARVSPTLSRVLHKMLEISPRDRFGSAREILQALFPNAPLPPLESMDALKAKTAPDPSDRPAAARNRLDLAPTQALESADTDTMASITETHAPATNAIAATNTEAAVSANGEAPPPVKTRVLIVQDVQVLARSLARKLLRLEYSVADVVTSLQVARDRAVRESPDIILMELSLAGNPDVEAAASEIYEHLQIPTVYLASREDDPRLTQVRRERAYYGHVLRPYPDKTLQATIEAALNVHYRQLRDRVNRESTYGQQLKLAEETLNYLIYHDRGTGLPNHLSLREQFSQALRRRHLETGGSEAASLPVGCLGLDCPGDSKTLPEISRHLRGCIGGENGLAYLGDERFAIVWPSLHQETDVAAVAVRLLAEMSALGYPCSLGIACNWQQALPIDRLLARAQTALDAAWRRGGNCHAFYHTQLETASYGPDSEHILLEKELNFALDRNELQLYYQPRIDLHDEQLTGVEALVRWFHPQLGNVSPNRFLPVAEDIGLMAPIGEWVCREASRQVRCWQEAYGLPLVLAINLDSAQFSSPNLDRTLATILTASDFDPHLLELEVTESLLVSDSQRAQQQLRALKALGIKIAIDDFGTGYSSLSYLRQFPFDILKIDRCFVHNLHRDEKNGAIAVAIAQMAASLELRVVAEGVEAEAELAFLRQHPCNEAQGYFFSPPLSADRFALWLADKHDRTDSSSTD